MFRFKEKGVWVSWILFTTLAFLLALLAIVQSRWIDQISNAQRQRMQLSLESSLNQLSLEFDRAIVNDCAEIIPPFLVVESEGTEAACARQYNLWRPSHERVFQKVALALTGTNPPELSVLDLDTAAFSKEEWPEAWLALRTRVTASSPFERPTPSLNQEATAFAFPIFGSLHRGPEAEAEVSGLQPVSRSETGRPVDDWLILDLNVQYLSRVLLPDLMSKHLDTAYAAKIVLNGNPSLTILNVGDATFSKEDASVKLLDPVRLEKASPEERGGPERRNFFAGSGQPRWQLLVHRTGTSVDDAVLVVRWRNIALSIGILLLMLTMVGALFYYSRRANQLAEIQMRFVAGVSHDLRTPLTVIRTAAYNLKGRVATRPEQVEKYGALIQQESDKLSSLVEQVLRFNAGKSGRIVGEQKPIPVETLIEASLESSLAMPASKGVIVERRIEGQLPPILGDRLALKHALQNLFDNAIKYGLEGSDWIGVSAQSIVEAGKEMVEIRVSDRGPGIPAKEHGTVFQEFVRGQNAMQDHVQGTGLGLSLVKSIVEAHGGSIKLVDGVPRGATFIMTLPAASMEVEDAVADFIR